LNPSSSPKPQTAAPTAPTRSPRPTSPTTSPAPAGPKIQAGPIPKSSTDPQIQAGPLSGQSLPGGVNNPFGFLVARTAKNPYIGQSSWKQILNVTGEERGDHAGEAVSYTLNGQHKAVGYPGANYKTGVVRVYQVNGLKWEQVGNSINGESFGEEFGRSVALSSDGRRLIVGAPKNSNVHSMAGRVRAYQLKDGEWKYVGSSIYGEYPNDQAGFAVSISDDGTVFAVGAPHRSGQLPGSVRIFQLNVTSQDWTQMENTFSRGRLGDECGYSISLSASGKMLAAGCPSWGQNNEKVGKVIILRADQTGTWLLHSQSFVGDTSGAALGSTVSVSNDGKTLAFGLPGLSKGSRVRAGGVRVMKYNQFSDSWEQLGRDMIGHRRGYEIGKSVSLSANGRVVAFDAGPFYEKEVRAGELVSVRSFDGRNWHPNGTDLVIRQVSSYYQVGLNGDGNQIIVGFDNVARTGVVAHHSFINNPAM